MNGQGHDRFDPLDEALLGDFVATLREGSPTAAELAPVRRALVGPARRGTPWLKLLLVLAALGLGPPHPTHEARAARETNEAALTSSESNAARGERVEAEPATTPVLRAVSDSDDVVAIEVPLARAPLGASPRAPRSRSVRLASESLAAGPEGLPSPSEGLPSPSEGLASPSEGLVSVSEGLASGSEGLASGSEARVVSWPSTGKSDETTVSQHEGEPSVLFASAMRRVAADRSEEAAPLLSRVVEGETNDSSECVEQAELALTRCLFTLGYVTTAASVADAIATRPDHRGRLATLELLARLGERLPDPHAVVGTVGHYRADELVHAEPRHLGTLRYLLGRARYDAGEVEEAVALFASVPAGHRFYVPSRYLEGMSHARAPRAARHRSVRGGARGLAGLGRRGQW
jgi:hypothetical protein